MNASDFTDNSLTGIATVMNGRAIITKTLASDFTPEGDESFTFNIKTSAGGPIIATSAPIVVADTSVPTVTPSATILTEGSPVTFNLSSNQLSSTLYWDLNTVSGTINASDFVGAATTGSFTTNGSGVGSTTLTLANDLTTEGTESFQLQVRTGSTSGTIIATSATVVVLDTSLTPPIVSVSPSTTSVNEGSAVTFNVSSNQLSSTLYWTLNPISGTINASDFVGAATTGSFTTNGSGVGSTTLTLANDSTTEGTESFQLQVRTVSTSGTISTTSSTITVADTSTAIPIDPPASTTTTNTFSYVGFPETFTVPSNVYWLKVTANGAGGGKGNGTQNGGSGGQVVGWVPVQPGEVYKVIVGGGGKGKGTTAVDRFGGGGGGFSGLLFNSSNNHTITAGGGGGSQTNSPVTSGGTSLNISGGHTLVGNTSSAAGGSGGIANSSASSDPILNGSSGTGSGSGGNGGTSWTGSLNLDAGGGGGGGGYGTGAGIGGNGSNGGTDALSGKGGDGGFGGGGGGGGGGTGGTSERTNPAGGGGGGHIGGQGGLNTPTFNWRSGEGGYNFLYWYLLSHPRGGSTALLISTTSGGGSAGATVSGNDGTNGSVTIQYATQ